MDSTYYPTGVKVSKRDLAQLSIRHKRVRQNGTTRSHPRCEVVSGRLLSNSLIFFVRLTRSEATKN
jgi:hypothetical protein